MEREAEHGRASHQRAIFRCQRVDARHRRRLGRIGQPAGAAGLDGGAQQVAQELRVAAGAVGHDMQHVERQRVAARPRSAPGAARRPAASGASSMRDAVGAAGIVNPPAVARRATPKSQGWLPAVPREIREQLGRRDVHLVRVLEYEQRGTGNHRREKGGRPTRAASAGGSSRPAARPPVSAAMSSPNAMPTSDSHGMQVRRLRSRRFRAGAARPPRRCRRARSRTFAQQFLPHRVRCRRGVGLTDCVQDAKFSRLSAQRVEKPRLAHPGLPDDLDQAGRCPLARRRALRAAP